MRLTFWIAGKPKAQPRTKSRAFRGKTGQVISSVYTPKTADGWKECCMIAARPYLQAEPLQGALLVSLAFFFERPQRLLRKKDPEHPLPYDAKPDRDNSDKAVLDALSDIGLWGDDCQATCGGVSKWYVAKGGRPGAMVVIEALDERAWFTCTDQAVTAARQENTP